MKILTLGKNGFIANHLPYQIADYYLSINEFDIKLFINKFKPDVIINAAGFCGKPNIDECETKQTETYNKNVILPLLLANECQKHDIRLVHFGSGCIFCGDAPTIDGWREDANANPKSYYSKTKYAADLALSPLPNTTILRLRMPISYKNNPRNLLNKIISYQKVLDHPNSMTFLDDLVRATDFIIKKEKTGIYNVVSSMPLTHPMLLEEYKKYVPTHTYEKITEKELDGMVKATRSNCILSNKKIVSEGFEFAPTLACMHGTIKKFAKNK